MNACIRYAKVGVALVLLGAMTACAAKQSAGPAGSLTGEPLGTPGGSPTPGVSPSSSTPDRGTILFESEGAEGGVGGLTAPVVERGTGRLVGQPGRAAPGVSFDDAGDISLNLIDADIREVVRLVLEDGLGANYVIDPTVAGSITVRSSRPVPAADVIGTLNSILNLNGAALIQEGSLFKVVPTDQATASGRPQIRSVVSKGGPPSGIQVAPLRYADAVQLAELLQPFVANQGSVQPDIARNTLLLTGSADQVGTMGELIDMFDVDWMAGMSFGLYPLEEASPAQLADELDQIFGDPAEDIRAGGLRFVPIERLSALLVITTQPTVLDRAASWIERLDKAGDGDGEQVYVYAVQNGRAADLAAVLGELFDIHSTAVGDESLLAPGLEPIELRSSLPTFDQSGDPATGGGELPGEGAERSRPGQRNSRSRTGGDGAGQRELTQGRDQGGTRIVADETSNALLIRATAGEYKKIRSALKELDKLPLQVLQEATIAEVSLEDRLSYGIQWFFGNDQANVALSEFPNRSVGEFFSTGFSGLISRGDVRIVLNALDEASEVNVISSPQILVLDNQTAQLEVGDEVPIVTQQAENVDNTDSRIVSTVEQRQTGVILNVTPRVNASGLVVLDIEQEVSDVVRTTTSGIDSPTIAQRRIGTSVAVGNDQTVVLGGLIQDDVDDIASGVPFLRDIPIIGFLFGTTTKITSRTELLVLISPKVLTSQEEAVEVTEELRRRLRVLEPLQAKIAGVTADRQQEPQPFEGGHAEPSRKGYVVQLTSLPSEADARRAWDDYQQRHGDDLRALTPIIKKSEVEGGPIYGLQAGWFDSFVTADQLCAKLIPQGTDCLVIEKH